MTQNALSIAILDTVTNERKACRRVEKVDNIHYVSVIHGENNMIHISLCIYTRVFNHLVYDTSNIQDEIGFFEAFGFDDSFKYVFENIEETTKFSKQEVSTIVRHKIKCDSIDEDIICFKFKISKSMIKT